MPSYNEIQTTSCVLFPHTFPDRYHHGKLHVYPSVLVMVIHIDLSHRECGSTKQEKVPVLHPASYRYFYMWYAEIRARHRSLNPASFL